MKAYTYFVRTPIRLATLIQKVANHDLSRNHKDKLQAGVKFDAQNIDQP